MQQTVKVKVLKPCVRGGEALDKDTITQWDAADAPRAAKNGLIEIIEAPAKK